MGPAFFDGCHGQRSEAESAVSTTRRVGAAAKCSIFILHPLAFSLGIIGRVPIVPTKAVTYFGCHRSRRAGICQSALLAADSLYCLTRAVGPPLNTPT